MNNPKKVFLSGPIFDKSDTYNEDFDAAAKGVVAVGDVPINPATLPVGLSQRDYMRISLAMLEAADIVVQLPGWADSAGANIECAMANKAGIPCTTYRAYMDSHLPNNGGVQGPAPKLEDKPVSRVERLFGKKETWSKTADESPDDDPEIEDFNRRAVKGFMITQCEDCGDVKGFCARTPITAFKCKKCGHDTPIDRDSVRPAYAKCKCGREFRYMTNATTENLSINCISCGAPIDMKLNKRCTAYVTPREAGGGITDRPFGKRPYYLAESPSRFD